MVAGSGIWYLRYLPAGSTETCPYKSCIALSHLEENNINGDPVDKAIYFPGGVGTPDSPACAYGVLRTAAPGRAAVPFVLFAP